jgi:hypothetical protein
MPQITTTGFTPDLLPQARRPWTRHFTPVCHSMIRHPELGW